MVDRRTLRVAPSREHTNAAALTAPDPGRDPDDETMTDERVLGLEGPRHSVSSTRETRAMTVWVSLGPLE